MWYLHQISVPFCFLFVRVKTKLEDVEYAHLPNAETNEELSVHCDGDKQKATRRRGLRSDRSTDSLTNGVSHAETNNFKATSR